MVLTRIGIPSIGYPKCLVRYISPYAVNHNPDLQRSVDIVLVSAVIRERGKRAVRL